MSSVPVIRSSLLGMFKRLRGPWPAFASHSVLLVGGTALSQAIQALSSPLLTRLYSPNDFGMFALTFAIYGALAPIVCLRYDNAVPIPENEEEAAQVAATCLVSTVVVAFVSGLICTVISMLHPAARLAEIIFLLLLLLPFGLFVLGVQRTLQSWSTRAHAFKAAAIALCAQAAVTAAIQVCLAWIWGGNQYFLVIGTQAGLIASVVIFAVAFRRSAIPLIRQSFTERGIVFAAKKFIRFPKYSAPYGFVAQAAARMTLVIIAVLASTAVVGQFALAQRVIYLPITIIMAAASQIYFSRAARRFHDLQFRESIKRALVLGTIALAPWFVLVALFAEPIFRFVFGANWDEAGRFATALAYASMITTLTFWLDRTYDILGRQRLALIIQMASDFVTLLALFLVLYFTKSPFLAVCAYAVMVCVVCLVWLYITIRIAGLPDSYMIQFLGALVAAVGPMLVSYGVLTAFDFSPVQLGIALSATAMATSLIGFRFQLGRGGFGSLSLAALARTFRGREF